MLSRPKHRRKPMPLLNQQLQARLGECSKHSKRSKCSRRSKHSNWHRRSISKPYRRTKPKLHKLLLCLTAHPSHLVSPPLTWPDLQRL